MPKISQKKAKTFKNPVKKNKNSHSFENLAKAAAATFFHLCYDHEFP